MALNQLPRLMDTIQLAETARALRRQKDLTQAEVAERLVEAGYADSLSIQAISNAENPDTGSKMNSLRVAIIELLAGRKVTGPYWRLEDEPA